jgi:predicted nucleotide-binding protein
MRNKREALDSASWASLHHRYITGKGRRRTGRMSTHKELLLSLHDGFEQLELFDDSGLNALRVRGQMIIRRVFGTDSSYSEQLSSIEFYYTGPFIARLGAPETVAERQARERAWRSGQRESIALINTMLEDLELGEPEQMQGVKDLTVPKSSRVFVVHGHDNEMKQAVARTVERLGLEAVILHEKPNRGQTIIEKIERFSDVSFAIVLLSPDDTGYSNADGSDAAHPRARQNVILGLGYFAGKLGRENVVALHRGAIELPSDYDGVLYTQYDGDSGAWRGRLVAELKDSGYSVSADDL